MVTKFLVMIPPDHYGISLKTIIIDTEFISIELRSGG